MEFSKAHNPWLDHQLNAATALPTTAQTAPQAEIKAVVQTVQHNRLCLQITQKGMPSGVAAECFGHLLYDGFSREIGVREEQWEFRHRCPSCGGSVYLQRIYPYYTYEPLPPSPVFMAMEPSVIAVEFSARLAEELAAEGAPHDGDDENDLAEPLR